MNSNEKTKCSEVDEEKSRMDSERKARRSSILKPQKPRNPFSTLDFTEPNPDNTLARASRRVSFASSNFVKPFAADPEKNTIWDNTYEEEVNHTDSTKSSYEQTQEAKSTDILNLTSIYSPTSNKEFFKDVSPPQNIYPERVIGTSRSSTHNENKESTNINYKNDNRVANTMGSLIAFARSSNNKPALNTHINKTIYTEDFMKITHSVGAENPISNPFINDISLITPLNDTMDMTNNHTHMTVHAMEMTTCINKENVNPIINDISLVTPIESKLRRSSRLKGKMSNVNVDQEKIKENAIHTKNYPENAQLQNYLGQTVIFNQCDMELTGSLSITNIKENLIEKANSPTTYSLEDMELTKALDVKNKTVTVLHDNEPKYNKMDTINFNRSEHDMEFTCTLPLSVGNQRPIDVRNENLEESDMEFTTPFLDKNAIIENFTDPKRATIPYTTSDSDMTFTTNLSTKKEQINERETIVKNSTSSKVKHIQSIEEEDMDFTTPFLGKNAIIEHSTDRNGATILYTKYENAMEFTAIKNEQINREDVNKNSTSSKIRHIQSIEGEDMEFTTPFLGKNAIIEHSTDPKRTTILCTKSEDDKYNKINTINFNRSEGDMEFTCTLPLSVGNKRPTDDVRNENRLEESDMEFTTPFLDNNAIIKNFTDPKRAISLYSKSEGDMEITTTLSTKKKQINEKDTNTSSKMKCVQSIKEEDMEFTTPFLDKKDLLENSTGSERTTFYAKSENIKYNKMNTINFNKSEANMEFTCTLPLSVGNKRPIDDVRNENIEECDVEFTTPFLDKNAVIENFTDPKKTAILYTKSKSDMDCTTNISTKKEQIAEKNTSTSSKVKHIQSIEEEDMEFTTPFLNKNAVTESCQDPKRATILYAKSEDDMEFTATLPTKSEQIKEKDTTICTENQMKIIVDPLPKIEANIMVSPPPIINSSNSDNKRHSNSENDDEVIKRIKIDHLSLNEHEPDKFANENNDGRKTFLVYNQTGKYSENNLLPITAIDTDKSDTVGLLCKETENVLEDALPIEENKIDIKTDTNQIHCDLVPVSTPSVSFHMNLTNMSPCIEDTQQLIHATFSKPESLEMLLGKKPVPLKPHGNIIYNKDVSISSDIGSFEKSLHKTVDESSEGNEKTFTPDQCRDIENTCVVEKTFKEMSLTLKGFTEKKDSNDCMGMNKENCLSSTFSSKTESCYIEDISVVDLAPANLDESSLVGNTSNSVTNEDVKLVSEHKSNKQDESFNNANTNLVTNEDVKLVSEHNSNKQDESFNNASTNLVANEDVKLVSEHKNNKQDESFNNASTNLVTNEDVKLVSEHNSNEQDESFNNASTCNDHNSTLRCRSVLTNIEKYLISYQINRDHDYSNITRQIEELKEQNLIIKDLIKNFQLPKIPLIDLEEKHKQDMENSSSRVGEAVMDAETDREAPSVAGLVAPKSLHDRICETAERCKKHWEFVKMEDDYYYFRTLFGTLGFKVHVHSELGMVYSIETFTNLVAIAKPICWYELKLFQQKLKEENLLSVLGAKFDILTLLDYVCMTMEEIINCHTEYNNLVKKYVKSHHFRMESDFSVIFEIINIDLIICWKISIKMSPTSSVSKDDITATFKVGEKVNEEDIKCIAENTPKGPHFIRNFIENVDEYVRRIAKKIKFRRGDR